MSFARLWVANGGPNGPPVLAGGLALATDWNNGHLFALDLNNGATVANVATDPLEHFAPVAVGDRLVLVPTVRGVEAFSALR
jgi:outer membrane protein assembly factor BamB